MIVNTSLVLSENPYSPTLARVLLDPADRLLGLLTRVGWLSLTMVPVYLHLRYPLTAVLDGIPGRVPGYRRLTHAPLTQDSSGLGKWVTLHRLTSWEGIAPSRP